MRQRLGIYVIAVFVACTAVAAAFHEPPYLSRHDEPTVFENIGPQENRSDNPVAAAAVALGVSLVSGFIYLLYRSDTYEWMKPFNRYFEYEDLDDKIEGTET